MSWAKLDDGFHSHPKVRTAMAKEPSSIALHVLAISYAAQYETDGHVPAWFVESVFANGESAPRRALDALIESGLWTANESGWVIHDYLDYNPSRTQLHAEREANRTRVKKHRERNGGVTDE